MSKVSLCVINGRIHKSLSETSTVQHTLFPLF